MIKPDSSDCSSLVVSGAELVRNFGQWRLAAMSGPVFITNHGRRTHVLSSVSDFAGLAANPPPARSGLATPGTETATPATGGDDLVAVADWIEEAVVICDRDLVIISANRIAYAICRRPPHALEGKPLLDALPELRGTLMEVHLRRTAVGSEPSAADIPSPFAAGAWVRMQSFPLGIRNVLLFRDITDEVQRHRLADVKEAIIEAMSVHGAIGYVRLSMRATIERVDQPFCDMIGLSEARMMGVDICDIVAIGDRHAFREHCEMVLAGQGSQRIEVGFLTNQGKLVRASVAIVQLHGAYSAEGAVMLITQTHEGEDAA